MAHTPTGGYPHGGGSPMEIDPMRHHKSLFWLSDSNSTESIYPRRVSTRIVFLNFCYFVNVYVCFAYVCLFLN